MSYINILIGVRGNITALQFPYQADKSYAPIGGIWSHCKFGELENSHQQNNFRQIPEQIQNKAEALDGSYILQQKHIHLIFQIIILSESILFSGPHFPTRSIRITVTKF
jgi:hypothetical protein